MSDPYKDLDQALVEVIKNMPPFRAGVIHEVAMDQLMYLGEDVSYRASGPIGSFSILLHPQEERVVGIKIEGAEELFNLVALLGKQEVHIREMVALAFCRDTLIKNQNFFDEVELVKKILNFLTIEGLKQSDMHARKEEGPKDL